MSVPLAIYFQWRFGNFPPSNLNVPLDFVLGNTESLGKAKLLADIKCTLFSVYGACACSQLAKVLHFICIQTNTQKLERNNALTFFRKN